MVELLVGAALSAAVMAAVLSSYIYLGRGLGRLANQQVVDTETRRTLAYFTQDVQSATGLADTANLSATRVSLLVSGSSGNNTITYYYNNAATATNVTIDSIAISMAENSLTRVVSDGTTVTSLTLLRNIPASGCTIRYYDIRGGTYSTYTNYLSGIKQLSLQFRTQAGLADSGTQTRVYDAASSRLALRNRGYLP